MDDTKAELAKMAPPTSVLGLHFAGIPLNDWVSILTIIYLLLAILDKLFPEVRAGLSQWLKGLMR
jgi:hypothetical protein